MRVMHTPSCVILNAHTPLLHYNNGMSMASTRCYEMCAALQQCNEHPVCLASVHSFLLEEVRVVVNKTEIYWASIS